MMAANIRVIRAQDFIRATPDGRADVKAAERLLAELSRRAEELGQFQILVDTRRVCGALTAGELWYAAELLAKCHSGRARKTAVLCPLEKFDHTEFFSLCAENYGCNVRAFHNYEAAMEWLLE